MADFMSFDNLKLAWVRTLSGENTDYRSLQRIEIDSFGWAEDDNLRQLQKELSENVFSPSQTTKIYIPKPSGLLRPITVLRVLDTIVYQAIANRLAERARTHLSEYYLRSVFSNILTSAKGYPFFYRKWKFGCDRLDRERERVSRQGYQWIGELDLASFYDVIDHTLLRSILVDLCHEEECLQLLFSCLSKWTIHRIGGFQHGHGIPQGPLASSFLAECVLHYLDSRLTRLDNAVYFRYVDNITLLATNERDAKKVMAQIEMVCRELGLVPQVKRHIEKPRDLENLMFQEASPLEDDSSNVTETSPKQNAVLRKMFLGCFRGPKINMADEHLASKLNYSLFKMNPDRRVINKVLGLLYALPSVADAVTIVTIA